MRRGNAGSKHRRGHPGRLARAVLHMSRRSGCSRPGTPKSTAERCCSWSRITVSVQSDVVRQVRTRVNCLGLPFRTSSSSGKAQIGRLKAASWRRSSSLEQARWSCASAPRRVPGRSCANSASTGSKLVDAGHCQDCPGELDVAAGNRPIVAAIVERGLDQISELQGKTLSEVSVSAGVTRSSAHGCPSNSRRSSRPCRRRRSPRPCRSSP